MMRWIYPVILWLALPLVWLRLQLRSRREPAYGLRQQERFGAVPTGIRPAPIWFHTVSAGESIAAAPLIAELTAAFAQLPFLVTTMTPTGSEQVISRLGERVDHCYAPYDFAFAVRRFYARVQPRMLVLMETELWPNLIAEAHLRNIPVMLVNARLSARSVRGYQKVSSLSLTMVRQLTYIACQSQAHRQRFISLGADPDKVQALGSVKFDVTLPAGLRAKADELAARCGFTDKAVWIAASTHPGEEQMVLATFAVLRRRYPDWRLVLVPRHPHRATAVAAQISQQGFSVVRQSELTNSPTPVDVLLGDVMGTLLQLYGLADIAFVGGSLVDVGGHNPIEPALLALPILSGPQQYNFSEVFAQFSAVDAAVTVADGQALTEAMLTLLANPEERARMGQAALAVVEENRGASQRLVQRLSQQISGLGD